MSGEQSKQQYLVPDIQIVALAEPCILCTSQEDDGSYMDNIDI